MPSDDLNPEPRRRPGEDGSGWLGRLWVWMTDRRETRIGRELAAAVRRRKAKRRDDEPPREVTR